MPKIINMINALVDDYYIKKYLKYFYNLTNNNKISIELESMEPFILSKYKECFRIKIPSFLIPSAIRVRLAVARSINFAMAYGMVISKKFFYIKENIILGDDRLKSLADKYRDMLDDTTYKLIMTRMV